MHEFTLISTIAAGFALALVLGVLAAPAKLPALVGYLLAGILIGPATPGFVADMALTSELAEIGVMLTGARAWCSGSRSRWRVRWCCSGRSSRAARSTR